MRKQRQDKMRSRISCCSLRCGELTRSFKMLNILSLKKLLLDDLPFTFPSFHAINDFISHTEIVLWNLKWYFFALAALFIIWDLFPLFYFDSNKFYSSLTRTLLFLTNRLKWYFHAFSRTAAVKRNVLSQSAFVENLLSFLQRKFLFYQFSSHSAFFSSREHFTLVFICGTVKRIFK